SYLHISDGQRSRSVITGEKPVALPQPLGLAWRMRIEQPDPADEQVARACYNVVLAAHKADEPVEAPMSPRIFSLYLRQGWEKTPGEVWTAVDDAGAIVGF